MKKFSEKVQRLSQRAAEIKHAIESVPPKVVEIRDAVTAATGQVQKIRADMMTGVSALRAENDTQLVTALREIDAASDVLEEAGVQLAGVDLDLGPARKIKVHLEWHEDVDAKHVRQLLHANAQRGTIAALLTALLKADELSEQVQLEHLRHATITVEIGLVPSVRVGWRADGAFAAPSAAASEPEGAHAKPSEFVQSSYFVRAGKTPLADGATAEPVGTTAANPAAPTPFAVAAHAPSSPEASVQRTRWQASALDRFKKMPDLTKSSQR